MDGDQHPCTHGDLVEDLRNVLYVAQPGDALQFLGNYDGVSGIQAVSKPEEAPSGLDRGAVSLHDIGVALVRVGRITAREVHVVVVTLFRLKDKGALVVYRADDLHGPWV